MHKSPPPQPNKFDIETDIFPHTKVIHVNKKSHRYVKIIQMQNISFHIYKVINEVDIWSRMSILIRILIRNILFMSECI